MADEIPAEQIPAPFSLITGDCFDALPGIADDSVDLICSDLPYGVLTACKWDKCLPLPALWEQYKRILKPTGVIVLTAIQPFTSDLVQSNREWFRYADVWDKRMPVGHLNAKKRPLRRHEDILVFSPARLGRFTYNPQMRPGKMHDRGNRGGGRRVGDKAYDRLRVMASQKTDLYYPTSIFHSEAQGDSHAAQLRKQHPTQKPVSLFEYFIRTYSNEGDLVLDNCAGVGTTGVACLRSGRRFIGMEISQEYAVIALERLRNECQRLLSGVA